MNKEQGKSQGESLRAVFHASQTTLIASVAWIVGVWVLCAAFLVTAIVELARRYYEPLQKVIVHYCGSFMDEREKVFPNPKLTGVLPMIGGLIIAMTFLPLRQFWLMVATLSFGDPAARELGVRYGKTVKIPWERKKSVVGLCSMWAVGAVIANLLGFSATVVLFATLAMTLAESVGSRANWYRDDNLLIPLAAIFIFMLI